ncbi:hypothetical protein [Amycolatopsis sp. NPDC051061]|uniref:hypothetical protein n=1 Tax=Amycolatopsis sp. NPDC051061 TaxID=3155042 RepID=UPI00343D8F8C
MALSSQSRAEDFAVRRRGSDLLIHLPGEAAPAARAVLLPGHVFVQISAAAAAAPALSTALPSLLHRHVATDRTVQAVRIGLLGLAADGRFPQAPAEALVEVFLPNGEFAADAGAALYAARGWQRFQPGKPPSFGGDRHPVPSWETELPTEPVTAGGVALNPISAGVVICGAGERSAASHALVFAVRVDQAAARVVVGADGRVPPATEVAAAVAHLLLSGHALHLVVLLSPARADTWLREFAAALGRDVIVAAAPAGGWGDDRFGPFMSLVRQSPGDGQEVAVAAPPPRWQRRDHAAYRLGADVVPSGVVVRTGRLDRVTAGLPHDPHGWTLYLGSPGARVSPELLAATEDLLGELTPKVRAVGPLRLLGRLSIEATALPDDLGRYQAERWEL